MPDRPWKRHERRSAGLIGGRRYPASQGGAVDVESAWAVAQCKEVKRLSLAALEALAPEVARQGHQRGKVGLVIVKRRGGAGRQTPTLVCMTAAMFQDMSGPLPGESQGAETA